MNEPTTPQSRGGAFAHQVRSSSVRPIAVAVTASALLAGLFAATEDVRLGLFAGALVLGWSQLVGL